MTAPYLARLACLSLACYFLMHTALAAAVWAIGKRAIRVAERLRPRDAARLLLTLRLLPALVAGLAVAGFCVPSFLWLEPSEAVEGVGAGCVAAALLGGLLWMLAAGRAARAIVQSRRYLRLCARAARQDRLAGGFPALVLDAPEPVLALVGVVHPPVVISRGLLTALRPEQLSAALRHEEAHRRSRDNWKRLALLAAPEILPGLRAFGALDRAWARVTEWAADEWAAGDARQRLDLAEALLSAVRMEWPRLPAGLLATTLLADPQELQVRVTRLLEDPPTAALGARYWGAAGVLAAAPALLLLLRPGTLYSVHWLLEGLMR